MKKHPQRPKTTHPSSATQSSTDRLWLYGKHAVIAALTNNKRKIYQILITKNTLDSLSMEKLDNYKNKKGEPLVKIVDINTINTLLPPESIHQGIAAEVAFLPSQNLEELGLKNLPSSATSLILLLDQVTDPHNVGAVLRSAAAFNVTTLIMPRHNSPQETAVMAKIASGALEIVPIIRVTNLVQAMEYLKSCGYWCVGMDGYANTTLYEAKLSGKIALVMGAEDKGLRRLTRDHCDLLVKLPIHSQMESLNVSNAAAIALYELSRPASTN